MKPLDSEPYGKLSGTSTRHFFRFFFTDGALPQPVILPNAMDRGGDFCD